MMRKSFLLLAGVALTAAVLAASADAQRGVTVGDFAVKMSRAMGHDDTVDRDSAVQSLRKYGVDLGKSLDATMSEGDAVRILADLGIQVQTSNPSNTLSASRLDVLATTVALTSIGPVGGSVTPMHPPEECRNLRGKKGKGKGKCERCCVQHLKREHRDIRNRKKVCKRFCKKGVFPSPSEPQP